jgi:cell division protein FtsB
MFSPKPSHERKLLLRKGVILVVALLFLSFVAISLFGDSGILVNMRVKTEHQRLIAERDQLLAENNRLTKEIRALKSDDRKIEALGRKAFGFGKPGEIVFYFPPDDPSGTIQRFENSSSSR